MTEDHKKGVDPKKIEIVKLCLDASFKDVRYRQDAHFDRQRFVVHDGTHSSELVFTRQYLHDIRVEHLEWLRILMVTKLIPKVKANAGKKLSVSERGIEVSEKDAA